MLIKKEILINANVKKVWSVFSKLEDWPKWSGYVIKTKWLSKDKWEKDSEFMQVVKGFAFVRTFQSNPKILKIKPYNIVIWTGTRKLVRGLHIFKFQKVDNKTKVINIEHFTGVLAPFLFPLMKNNFNMSEIYHQSIENQRFSSVIGNAKHLPTYD